jgi:hypothetical protein
VRHEWPSFYRFAGACAVVTAATTLPIHLLSFPSATIEEQDPAAVGPRARRHLVVACSGRGEF